MNAIQVRTFLFGLAVATLSGCIVTEDAVQQTARTAAKNVVTTVIGQRFPGVDAAPYTDCIIDNATTDEILNIATGAITGPDEATAQIVLQIAGRPDTAKCIAQGALMAQLG